MPASSPLQPAEVTRAIFDLTGRRILVTGASRGLGRQLAMSFAAFGARVACVARNETALQETAAQAKEAGGESVLAIPADLRSQASIDEVVADVAGQFGGLDVLVNNAADDHDSSIEDTSLETWQRVTELNAQSVFLLCKAAAPHLMASGGYGKVINVASVLGTLGVRANAAYVASKHAVVGLTRALALEWARRGVQVNALCPGFIITDMTAHMHQDEAGNRWVIRNTPMGRWGECTDFAGAAVFLASRASDFMTGQTLVVDGGYAAQ
jgi:NAD(P)-dependent dehydrogenase (short-subunit alcohol dehydrogenase family)